MQIFEEQDGKNSIILLPKKDGQDLIEGINKLFEKKKLNKSSRSYKLLQHLVENLSVY